MPYPQGVATAKALPTTAAQPPKTTTTRNFFPRSQMEISADSIWMCWGDTDEFIRLVL
ncbi:MAG TPA: hypothetical protein VI585_10030 [Candidatus Binatia bacterium]